MAPDVNSFHFPDHVFVCIAVYLSWIRSSVVETNVGQGVVLRDDRPSAYPFDFAVLGHHEVQAQRVLQTLAHLRSRGRIHEPALRPHDAIGIVQTDEEGSPPTHMDIVRVESHLRAHAHDPLDHAAESRGLTMHLRNTGPRPLYPLQGDPFCFRRYVVVMAPIVVRGRSTLHPGFQCGAFEMAVCRAELLQRTWDCMLKDPEVKRTHDVKLDPPSVKCW